jgi:uncharacterized protein (UPF0332 family)
MTTEERKDLVNYRITKSKKTLAEIELLIQHELWNTAVNRLYYACYYAVIALLINKEIETLTHTRARQLFGLSFIKTGVIEKDFGKFYSRLFDLRHTGDYDDFIDSTKELVLDLLQPAVNLIMKIELIINESDNEDQ